MAKKVDPETEIETPQVDDTPAVDETNPAIADFLGEDAPEEEPKEETPEEEPKEEEKETPPTEEKPKEESAPDPEKIAQDVKKEYADKILNAIGITPEEEKRAEEEGLVAPWVKEGRTPKSYEEVAEWGAEVAEYKRSQKEAEVQKEQEAQKKTLEETNKKWNEYWDSQLSDLRSQGKLPKIENADDPNDAGRIAQRGLFEEMYRLNQRQGVHPVTSLKEVYYEHYQPKKQNQPPGADAPISGGTKVIEAPQGGEFSYNDIQGKDFYQLAEEGS
jgi:hypothetical protein